MKIIGIDLGTTNSVICCYRRGEPIIVKIDGKATVPSVVYISDDKIEVGDKAKRKALIHPNFVLSSMKRLIGTKHKIKINKNNYKPTDAAYHILSYIKNQTENALNDVVRDVVITVPAYFNEAQRKETKKAAERSGLKVLRLLPEPTAAAIAYGLQREKDQTILVFDLGGGTFDVSILEVKNNEFIVKAIDGNSQLGGDDFDNAVVEYLNSWIEDNTGQSARGIHIAQQKLKEEAERAKIELSQSKSTGINIPSILAGVDIEIDKFTRKDFEGLIQPYLNEIANKTNDVIKKSGLAVDDINRIVLVGGSSKIPVIQRLLTENIKQPYIADNMDTIVAQGAAIVCASLMSPTEMKGEEKPLPVVLVWKDVIPHSLGIDMQHGKELIFSPILKRNSHYPCEAASLGQRQHKWHEEIRMTVYRGEDKKPSNNTKLGELVMQISPQFRGKDIEVVIGCIFELDKNGLLTFTAVEMPVTSENIEDIKTIGMEHELNDGIVTYSSMESIIQKHNFTTEKIEIRGGLI